jgi:hypothetical protein
VRFRFASTNDAQVTLWVDSVAFAMSASCPNYPKYRTFVRQFDTVVKATRRHTTRDIRTRGPSHRCWSLTSLSSSRRFHPLCSIFSLQVVINPVEIDLGGGGGPFKQVALKRCYAGQSQEPTLLCCLHALRGRCYAEATRKS